MQYRAPTQAKMVLFLDSITPISPDNETTTSNRIYTPRPISIFAARCFYSKNLVRFYQSRMRHEILRLALNG